MSHPLIEVADLTVSYGRGVTVGPVSLNVQEGEFVSLLGPSGCGKTTTLRCIAGFETPWSGDIRIRGRSITRDAPNKRNVGFVFQSYALFPHMSVFENIAFGLRRRRVDGEQVKNRVEDVVKRLGLAGLERRLPTELSGGQQQRVALGRALAFDPDVLLLDEPLSNLDRKLRIHLRSELRFVHREFGKTVIFVTHDQEEALGLSDRIALMMRGSIIQSGSPRELYEKPANAAVADFIGECRLYDAELIESGAGGRIVVNPGAGIRWVFDDPENISAGNRNLRVAIREGALTLVSDNHEGENRFAVNVVDKYYAGGKSVLICRLPTGAEVLVHSSANEQALPSVESMAMCQLDPNKVRIFPGGAV